MKSDLILAGVEAVKLVELSERYGALLLVEAFNETSKEIGRQLVNQAQMVKRMTGAVEMPAESNAINRGSTAALILALIDGKQGEEFTTPEIVRNTGCSIAEVRTALSRLASRGRIRRVRFGVYGAMDQ